MTPRRPGRGRALRLAAAAVVAFALAWLLSGEIPALQAWVEQTFSPERYPHTERCIAAALEGDGRLIRRGRTEPLAGGYRVEGVTVEERTGGADSVRVVVACTIDEAGRITRLERSHVM